MKSNEAVLLASFYCGDPNLPVASNMQTTCE